MEQIKRGVPIVVKLRTFLFHAIIFAIILVVEIFVFQFFAKNAAVACSEVKRVNDAPHNEIVFSGQPTGSDYFYYLKQQHVSGTKNINVSCDILMIAPGETYGSNDIYFEGTLEEGTCAVSKNLAKEYGLGIGDVMKVTGAEKYFKVTRFIAAQAGIDKDFKRDGIVVLGYDKGLLNRQYSYVSFTTDGDAYPALISLVLIKNWKEENVKNLFIYAAISLAAFCAAIAVCERFLFMSRRQDYRVLVSLGKTSGRMFCIIWAENALKYLLPSFIVAAIYSSGLSCFGTMYLIPALFLPCAGILAITIYTLVLVRKYYKCPIKK